MKRVLQFGGGGGVFFDADTVRLDPEFRRLLGARLGGGDPGR